MNETTHESSTHSLIKIPAFDGLGEFKIDYKHELNKPFPYLLKIKLIVSLYIEEVGGNQKFKIMDVTCKYRIKVNDTLTALDLGYIWNKSAAYLVEIFNGFEKSKFGQTHEINFESAESISKNSVLPKIVEWFNSHN